MNFQFLNSKSLFTVFFVTFILIAVAPFGGLNYFVLQKVEDELKSSLNEEYYFMAHQITQTIEQVYFQQWIDDFKRLREMLNYDVTQDLSQKYALVEAFLFNDSSIITLSMQPPNQSEPLQFFKKDKLAPFIKTAPDYVRSFFAFAPSAAETTQDGVAIHPSIVLPRPDDPLMNAIFLPMETVFAFSPTQKARLRAVYAFSPAMEQISRQMAFGHKEMYLVNKGGDILYGKPYNRSFQSKRMEYPLMAKITPVLEGAPAVFQLETFEYKDSRYLGCFATLLSSDYALVLVEPYQFAYAPVRETKNQIIIWMLITISACFILAGIFAWLFSIMITQAQNALVDARNVADRANFAKSEFLANVSHEIRTPMNAILGFTDILEEELQDPNNRQYLSMIRSSGKTLMTLINDILDLSKIEAGKLQLDYLPVHPATLFNEIINFFALEIQEKELELILEVDVNTPEYLLLDEVRLRQIIVNLLGNAVKFTESGTIKLSAAAEAHGDSDEIVDFIFIIQDTGVGIAKEQQQQIFDAFEQQPGQDHAYYGGTGLGLTITKRLIQMMKGSISLKSALGQGSTFTVTLKNVRKADPPESLEKQPDRALESVWFNNASILIVDDLKVNRLLLKRFMKNCGLEFIEAENGKEAVDLTRERHPNLILMDIKMPVMDGVEAARIIRDDAETMGIPIVAATATAMKGDESHINALFDGYLKKPIKKDVLIDDLTRFLKQTFQKPPSDKPDAIQTDATDKYTPDKAAIRKMPELIRILETEYLPQWEMSTELLVMDEIKPFADDLKRLGREFDFTPLSNHGDQLNQYVHTYNVEGVKKKLAEFPQLLETLKKYV